LGRGGRELHLSYSRILLTRFQVIKEEKGNEKTEVCRHIQIVLYTKGSDGLILLIEKTTAPPIRRSPLSLKAEHQNKEKTAERVFQAERRRRKRRKEKGEVRRERRRKKKEEEGIEKRKE